MADILRARILAIACGYPDADDLDDLRKDPAFKLACGRLPESGDDLASQPTMSRWENAPDLRTLIRWPAPWWTCGARATAVRPKAITLDIDDTADTVHGHQQLSLFNAHYDERCFLPIHVYDADTGHCVVTILRPGKTPDGKEVRAHLRRLVRRIRLHWPNTVITIRGDSHYGRREAMAWCEAEWHSIRLRPVQERHPGCPGLCQDRRSAHPSCDRQSQMWCATTPRPAMPPNPGHIPAASWRGSRRHPKASIPVTSSPTSPIVPPQWLYDSLYCIRGQAENLIKRHKSQLASDRTSCRSPLANQMRLILHTAAYWLMRTIRNAIPAPQPLASGEFSTIRLRLLKIAVRIKETASRIRLAFASNCPDAALFRGLVGALILRPT